MIVYIIMIVVLVAALLIMYFAMRSQSERMAQEAELRFKALARETLDQNARTVNDENARQLQSLLTPLRMRLEDFNRSAEATTRDAAASRRSLADQIDRLLKLNLTIGEEARNLSQALRGNNRAQGEWGETMLQTILESAGLKEGLNYRPQLTRTASGEVLRNDEGQMVRPDMVIFLPGSRNIIVDSKTSLSAYVDYCSASTKEAEAEAAKRHIASIRRHIEQLSAKGYTKSVENAADQILMFIPNDAALILALDRDPSLLNFATQRKISLVTPTQLMSTVMLIAELWRKDTQDRNAAETAKLGGLLYDSVAQFLKDMKNVERNLDAAKTAYLSATARLTDGPRSIVARAERLREMGAKNTRTITDDFATKTP